MNCCKKQNNKCIDKTECCGVTEKNQDEKKIVIDFLYLDLDECTRCKGTDKSLEDAITDVAKVVELTGVKVVLNKIHIDSAEKATKYKFLSSPTIRVNGKDIQLDVRESLCESCGDICGEEVDCRVWVYNGKEYTVPPKGMIVEAILREIYSHNEISAEIKNINEQNYQLPENLKKFFQSMENKKNSNS